MSRKIAVFRKVAVFAGISAVLSTAAMPAYADSSHVRAAVTRPGGLMRVIPGSPVPAPRSADDAPSCAAITFSGDAGAISVQTSPAGTVAWGIYMYDSAANDGPWSVDVYVDSRRVDHKDQNYAPHGSVSPADATSGSTFHIDAVHTDLQGNEYTSVPNACVIP